ncbi:MAG: DUF4149 domain-containing protein [Polyangiaceae bacterium]|nr:DUF4149 domain-containing protein [Polyangiaceae bacterium]
MGEERFSASDLEPSADEIAARRRGVIDRVAAAVATLGAGTLFGGLFALGFCAAPMVFRMTPAPFSGNAMGAAFARWDRVAVITAGVVLVCEVVRTWAARGRSRQLWPRIRRIAAVVVAICATYIGTSLSPRILELHEAGARRGDGEKGLELDAVHKRAEMFGKIEAVLAVALVGLHIFTLRTRDDEDDEENDAPAPLAPGPR